MHFWDWKTGYNFQRLQAAVQPGSIDSEAGIFALQYDKSGSRLITAEADKTIKIYKEDETAVRFVVNSKTCEKIKTTLGQVSRIPISEVSLFHGVNCS
jgi:WD40 repeat protein